MGCLSAAAENVYLYWGENIPQEELFDIIGTNESYLVLDARKRGFNANIFRATQNELNQIIYENNTPIILKIVSPSSPTAAHAIIMTGYDNITKEITCISNGVGKDLKMSYSKLLSLSFNSSNPEKQISIMICQRM